MRLKLAFPERVAMNTRTSPTALLLAALFAGCGGGGGSIDTSPAISALRLFPDAVYVGAPGSTTDVAGELEFADSNGDLDTLTLTILDAGGTTLSSTTYDLGIVGHPQSGTIDGVFNVSTESAARYTVRLRVTDQQGKDSNELQTEFRVSEFPWVARQPMPAKRRDFASAALGGLIYVVGGGDTLAGTVPAPATNTLQVYDPATDTWDSGPTLPWAVTDHIALAYSGMLYVIGQVYDGGYRERVQRFDPGAQSWSLEADGLLGQKQAGAAVLDGRVLLVGGTGAGLDLSALDVYDPLLDSWSSAAAMTTPRKSLAAAELGGKLLALGGYSTAFVLDGGYHRTVESYDPLLDAWSAAPEMPEPRANFAVAVIGTQLYVAGGGNVARALDTLVMFDSATGAWTHKTSMPSALAWPRGAVVDGKVYVFETDVTYEYTPGNDIH